MKAHPAQPDEAPELDGEAFAASWLITGLTLVLTVASLFAAALG